jgi:hypothetical protein
MPVYTATYFRKGELSCEVTLKTHNISNHNGLVLAVLRIMMSRKPVKEKCVHVREMLSCNIQRETLLLTMFSVQACQPLTFLIKTVLISVSYLCVAVF